MIPELHLASVPVPAGEARTLLEKRVLILAPLGRTATLARNILQKASFTAEVCGTVAELTREMERGAGAAVLLEEALATAADARTLATALQGQPAWSDLPVCVFVADLERAALAFRELYRLAPGRSIVVLERPIRAAALISLVGSLLQGRERQYQVRNLLAELQLARSEAEAANRTKSEFLAVMSHELRTPLNAILGFGDLVYNEISGSISEVPKHQVGRILKSAWHLLGLIEDILTYSRLEAGKEEVTIELVDVAEMARDMTAVVEPMAASKQLALQVAVPDARIGIETDARKLRQILLNLLGNAVKFTDHGGIALIVEHAPGGGVIFRIRDTGGGIAPEHLETIFEAFEQVDPSLTRRQQGTGLGLGVSRKLAHLLGGELSVESELNVGSTFTLELPARDLRARGAPA